MGKELEFKEKNVSIKIREKDYLVLKAKSVELNKTMIELVSYLAKDALVLEDINKIPESEEQEFLLEFRKYIKNTVVKDNNRILGIYFNTEKLLIDMYRDMHFLLNSKEYQEGKMEHPFIADYKLMHNVLRKLLKESYGIDDDDKLREALGNIKPKGLAKDYFMCLDRTNSGLVAFMKYHR